MHSSLLLFTIFTLLGVQVGFLKISVSPDDWNSLQTRFKRAAGCDDKKLVDKIDDLKFPETFKDVKKPWVNERLKLAVYSSDNVKAGFEEMFKLKVPGLGVYIKVVLDYLYEKECLSFPFGGSVRDMLLDKKPGDLDMDSNCGAKTMYNYCVEKWVTGAKLPAEVCSINGGETVMHIGKMKAGAKTEELDVANLVFCDGTGLEFTANAIGYFTNPTTGSIIIDVSGMGVANVCTKKIGIPVIKDSFEKWFSSPKNGYYTMYRAWKLRAKGFDFKDDDTKIKQLLDLKILLLCCS